MCVLQIENSMQETLLQQGTATGINYISCSFPISATFFSLLLFSLLFDDLQCTYDVLQMPYTSTRSKSQNRFDSF